MKEITSNEIDHVLNYELEDSFISKGTSSTDYNYLIKTFY